MVEECGDDPGIPLAILKVSTSMRTNQELFPRLVKPHNPRTPMATASGSGAQVLNVDLL
jgi:hypothetical protein